MAKVTVKVGQAVEFNVGVIGEPPPVTTWSFGGQDIGTPGDAHYMVTNEDYRTRFQLRNATRAMSGKYMLKAVNSSGEDTCETEVRNFQLDWQTE